MITYTRSLPSPIHRQSQLPVVPIRPLGVMSIQESTSSVSVVPLDPSLPRLRGTVRRSSSTTRVQPSSTQSRPPVSEEEMNTDNLVLPPIITLITLSARHSGSILGSFLNSWVSFGYKVDYRLSPTCRHCSRLHGLLHTCFIDMQRYD